MGDHPSIHEIDEEWREPSFDNVAAEHDDDRAPVLFCRRDRVDDAKEVTRDEEVGKGFEKRGEASILARGRRKLRRGDFVRAPLDGNGTDLREIGFRDGLGSRGPRFCARSPSLRRRGARTGAAVTAYWLGDGK